MNPRRRGGCYSGGRARAPQTLPRGGVFGVGVDVLQISRMAAVYARHSERLAQRLLHPAEQAALAGAKDRVNYIAKCFATKEAFVKALGTGFRGIAHDEVGCVRGALGRPQLAFSARVQARLAARGIGAAHLTLSDEHDLVCAVVVLERAG